MQIDTQRALYWKLEQIVEPVTRSRTNEFKNWLIKVGQSIVRFLTTQDELKIWQSKDWFGHSWWNVYIPKTEQRVRLNSEEEVRIWLEENLRF